MNEYPRLFTEQDVKCFCHIENNWAIQYATPAPILCARCKQALNFFKRQYYDLVAVPEQVH